MKKFLSFIGMFCVLSLTAVSLWGEDAASTAKKDAKEPTQFVDIHEVYDSLQKIPGKDEFETTDDFKKRVCTELQKIKFGNVNGNGILVCKIDAEFKYNADEKTAVISFPFYTRLEPYKDEYAFPSTTDSGTIHRLFLAKDRELIRTYVGQNAFGANTDVTEWEEKKYGLFFLSTRNVEVYDIESFTMTMDAATAKEAKSNIQCLVYFRLDPELGFQCSKSDILIHTKKDFHRPTRNEPRDEMTYAYYLFAKDIKFVFWNKKTGEIYYRTSLEKLPLKSQKRLEEEQARKKAEAERAKAEEEKAKAEEEKRKAEKAAEEEKLKAEKEKAEAEAKRIKAEEEKVKAEEQKKKREKAFQVLLSRIEDDYYLDWEIDGKTVKAKLTDVSDGEATLLPLSEMSPFNDKKAKKITIPVKELRQDNAAVYRRAFFQWKAFREPRQWTVTGDALAIRLGEDGKPTAVLRSRRTDENTITARYIAKHTQGDLDQNDSNDPRDQSVLYYLKDDSNDVYIMYLPEQFSKKDMEWIEKAEKQFVTARKMTDDGAKKGSSKTTNQKASKKSTKNKKKSKKSKSKAEEED